MANKGLVGDSLLKIAKDVIILSVTATGSGVDPNDFSVCYLPCSVDVCEFQDFWIPFPLIYGGEENSDLELQVWPTGVRQQRLCDEQASLTTRQLQVHGTAMAIL